MHQRLLAFTVALPNVDLVHDRPCIAKIIIAQIEGLGDPSDVLTHG